MTPRRLLAFIPFLIAVAAAIFLGANVVRDIEDPMAALTIPTLLCCFGIVCMGFATIALSASGGNKE
jgi:hypothetical protein